MGYSIAQAEALLAAIDRQETRRLADLLTVIATGAQGNSQAIRQALKELSP
jgi:hypothetical protein